MPSGPCGTRSKAPVLERQAFGGAVPGRRAAGRHHLGDVLRAAGRGAAAPRPGRPHAGLADLGPDRLPVVVHRRAVPRPAPHRDRAGATGPAPGRVPGAERGPGACCPSRARRSGPSTWSGPGPPSRRSARPTSTSASSPSRVSYEGSYELDEETLADGTIPRRRTPQRDGRPGSPRRCEAGRPDAAVPAPRSTSTSDHLARFSATLRLTWPGRCGNVQTNAPQKVAGSHALRSLSAAAGSCHKPPSQETRSYYMTRTAPEDAAVPRLRQRRQVGRLTLFFGAPTMVNGVPRSHAVGRAQPARVPDRPRGSRSSSGATRPAARTPTSACSSGSARPTAVIDARTDDWLYAHGRVWWEHCARHGHLGGHVLPVPRPDLRRLGLRAVLVAVRQGRELDARLRPHRQAARASTSTRPRTAAPPRPPSTSPATTAGTSGRCGTWPGSTTPACRSPRSTPPSGVNARQWQLVDLYGRHAPGLVTVLLRDHDPGEACRQNGGCSGTDNNPHQAQSFMLDWLNSDQRTSQGDIEGMTDIRWFT
jgi:hypothetical protein